MPSGADRSLIIVLPTLGTASNDKLDVAANVDPDEVLAEGAFVLIGKDRGRAHEVALATICPDEYYEVFPAEKAADMAALEGEFAKLTPKSRVYLHGHGNSNMGTLGNRNGIQMAKLLAPFLFNHPVQLISITGCKAAGNLNTGDDHTKLDVYSKRSFAYMFTAALALVGIVVDVYARGFNVSIAEGVSEVGGKALRPGQKVTKSQDFRGQTVDHRHKRPHSKVKYRYAGGDVTTQWVY